MSYSSVASRCKDHTLDYVGDKTKIDKCSLGQRGVGCDGVVSGQVSQLADSCRRRSWPSVFVC